MKRLVVCCDGTWNDADSATDFTNVVRIAHAIRTRDLRGAAPVEQIVTYHSGVGTEGDLFSRAIGGAVGLGLSRNIRDAYVFLADNYVDGDEIFLFGFSRGAYTARSLGGLLGFAGLISKSDMDDFALLWEGYRLRDRAGQPDILQRFPDRRPVVPIQCIGVWDTVGALGIPGHLDVLFTEFYQFHDTDLGAHVGNAFQALALDEQREDFQPTLWTQTDDGRKAGQVLRQAWFAGCHSNVGGGYSEHGLSDVALAWMAAQVAPLLALDDQYLLAKQDRRHGWGLGTLVDSSAGLWQLRGTVARTPFARAPQATCEALHASVAARLAAGAACDPAPYACKAALPADALARTAQLSAFEQELVWKPDPGLGPVGPVRPSPSLLNRLLQTVGGG